MTSLNNIPAGGNLFFAGAGTQKSVSTIIALIREQKKLPEVRTTAEDIIRDVCERNWLEEMKAIFNFVKNNMRYTQDIENVETVKTPLKQITDLRERGVMYGDCDDATVLLGALLASAGYVIRIVIIRSQWNTTGDFNHIYLHAQVPQTKQWVSLDATAKDKPFGWEAPFVERKAYNV